MALAHQPVRLRASPDLSCHVARPAAVHPKFIRQAGHLCRWLHQDMALGPDLEAQFWGGNAEGASCWVWKRIVIFCVEDPDVLLRICMVGKKLQVLLL